MADLLLEWLKIGLKPHELELGEPPGCGDLSYFYRNPLHCNLYVKFKVEWDFLLIMSFKAHRS